MKLAPKLVIFDVDGVLVDVRGSFHQSILETIHFFTGQRPAYAEIHRWKNRSGYNDDWRLTTDWIASLGKPVPYETVKARFQKIYWGTKGAPGNVSREKWLVTPSRLRKWSRRADLALFTGRTRRELRYTLKAVPEYDLFRRAVTMNDVKKGKPDPEGLHLLLDGVAPGDAVYLGDNIDDALAARSARVPFLGVLRQGTDAHRHRAATLRKLGALAVMNSVRDLEKFWR
jgi:HAD superfamily phosphatase